MTEGSIDKEILQSALDSIQEVLEFSEEYTEEEVFDAFNDIPEALWQDRYSSCLMIETIVKYKPYDWEIAVTDFIPESFWSNKENAKLAIDIIEGSDRDDIYGIFPKHCRDERDTALAMVSSDWRNLASMREEYKSNTQFVYTAIESLISEINNTRRNYPQAIVKPRVMLDGLIGSISNSLKSNKEFIMDLLAVQLQVDDFCDELDLVYNWIDQKLWSDKQFVMKIVKNDSAALKYASEELMSDEEFKNFTAEYC